MGQGSDQLNQYNDVSPADRQYSVEDDDSADTRAIEADIENTRAQMTDTINEIQERLNPQNLADQAKDAVVEAAQNVTEQAKDAIMEAAHNLTAQAKEAVYGATIGRVKGVSENMFDTIKENPLPAAIAALSLGWLFRKSGQRASYRSQHESPYSQSPYRQASYRQASYPSYGQDYSQGGQDYSQGNYAQGGYQSGYAQGGYQGGAQGNYAQGSYQQNNEGFGERVGDIADNVKDKASELRHDAMNVADNVMDKASDLRHDAMQQVEYLGDQAREQVEYASDWVQDTLYETPFAIGALALALGAAAGLAIPSTPIENRVMGEARDTLVEKVADTAQDTMDKVKTVAQEATDTVKTATETVTDKVKLEAREQGLTK